ncbi:MAG: chordopoxvirus fusion protein, partial [Desulfomonilaceae bacterium]
MESIESIFKDMKRDIRHVSSVFRYELEDMSYKSLPSILQRDYSIIVKGYLKRGFLEIGPKKYMELNIWGHGVKDGKAVEIVGEAKSQLKKRDVDKFLEALEILEPIINKQIVPLLVTYQTSPDVRRYIQG